MSRGIFSPHLFPTLTMYSLPSVCGISTMRMVTAKTNADNGAADMTWHYPVNLIWWCVSPGPLSTLPPMAPTPPPPFHPSHIQPHPPNHQPLTRIATQPRGRIHRHNLRLPALSQSLLQALLPGALPLLAGLRAARQLDLSLLHAAPRRHGYCCYYYGGSGGHYYCYGQCYGCWDGGE